MNKRRIVKSNLKNSAWCQEFETFIGNVARMTGLTTWDDDTVLVNRTGDDLVKFTVYVSDGSCAPCFVFYYDMVHCKSKIKLAYAVPQSAEDMMLDVLTRRIETKMKTIEYSMVAYFRRVLRNMPNGKNLLVNMHIEPIADYIEIYEADTFNLVGKVLYQAVLEVESAEETYADIIVDTVDKCNMEHQYHA